MKKAALYYLSTAILLSALFSCSKSDVPVPDPPVPSMGTDQFDSKIAMDWMEVTRQIVRGESKSPPQASRIYAYSGITLYESVVAGMPGNRSLSGQLSGLSGLPVYDKTVDYPAVANEALLTLERSIFGNLKASSQQSLDSMYAVVITQRKTEIDQATLDNSTEYGRMIAEVILKWADTDNFKETRTLVYTVPSYITNPGFWAPTDPVNLTPAEPYWGNLRCFSLTSSDMVEAPPLVSFDTIPGSAFYTQALEVLTINQNLTQGQKDIARWWSDGAGATSTPSGHWVGIENSLAYSLNLDLAAAAEMYALVGMVEGDAFISCWYTKYKYNLLRPKTYIQKYIAGNSTWNSFIPTPPFPEYPSGHSVVSGAVSEILTQLLGDVSFTDRANTNLGLNPRFYTSFYEAANEAAISRLYGGIHYREANETGIKQGRACAQYLMRRVKLKI
ncbi:MAG: vanadium-dependent haloperoxidase [Ferruginibacter sp.]